MVLEAVDQRQPKRMLRISVFSGQGDARRSQALIIAGAFDALEECPKIEAVQRGLAAIRQWCKETYPDYTDWRVLIDSVMFWPDGNDYA